MYKKEDKMDEVGDCIFIEGSTPSSKNGKRWTGKMLIGSKATVKYLRTSKQQWIDNKEIFLKMLEGKEKPYMIGFHFVRRTFHKYDFINPVQTTQDQMVKYGWIVDDNVDEMFPVPLSINGALTKYDKSAPGVYIKVM